MYCSRSKSSIEPRGHSALFLSIALLCVLGFENSLAYSGEVIRVIDGDLDSAIQKATTGDTIQCDPDFQILTDHAFLIDKTVSLFGLNAKLKDGVGRTEILLVTADNVHLADIQVTGNIDTISDKQRTSLIKFQAEGFVIERVVGKDCQKDVICVQGSPGNSIKGGLIQDIRGTNIGRDVVSIAGRYVLFKTLVSDLVIRRVKCSGSRIRGAVEISDGTRNIKVDDVYSENSLYGVDVQTHKEGETNENITVSNVVVKNCSHAIRMATKANSNKNLVFKNISGTKWNADAIPVQVHNATNVTFENVEISGEIAGGVIAEITKSNNVITKSFTHNSKPVTIEEITFNDSTSDIVLLGKTFHSKRHSTPRLTPGVVNSGVAAPSDLIHETFEGRSLFPKLNLVDVPTAPSGGVGAEVGQTRFGATTTEASLVTHSSRRLSIPIDSRAHFDASVLVGLKNAEQGDCKVRVRVFFDNKDSCTTSWVDLPGNAHETMQQLSWKDLSVNGDGATMITELRIQFSQEAFPQPAQDVYVDELNLRCFWLRGVPVSRAPGISGK